MIRHLLMFFSLAILLSSPNCHARIDGTEAAHDEEVVSPAQPDTVAPIGDVERIDSPQPILAMQPESDDEVAASDEVVDAKAESVVTADAKPNKDADADAGSNVAADADSNVAANAKADVDEEVDAEVDVDSNQEEVAEEEMTADDTKDEKVADEEEATSSAMYKFRMTQGQQFDGFMIGDAELDVLIGGLELKVPVQLVRQLDFSPTQEGRIRIQLQLNNDDRLTGEIVPSRLDVTTSWGSMKLNSAALKSLRQIQSTDNAEPIPARRAANQDQQQFEQDHAPAIISYPTVITDG